MSVRKHVSSFLHSVGEVMKNNRTIVIAVALSAIVAGGRAGYAWYTAQPARHYEYWHVPDRQPVPPLFHEAKLLTKSIERQDATWSAEMQQLQSLIEQQQPHEFDLSREISTTDALRAYVEKLLGLGEASVQSFLRTQATAQAERGPQAGAGQIRGDGGARSPLRGRDPAGRHEGGLHHARRYLAGESASCRGTSARR